MSDENLIVLVLADGIPKGEPGGLGRDKGQGRLLRLPFESLDISMMGHLPGVLVRI